MDRVTATARRVDIGATRPADTARRGAAPELGLRRVSWVRISLTEAGPVCEVAGIGHRVPTIRRIHLSTAAALAAAGVPTVLRRSSPARVTEP